MKAITLTQPWATLVAIGAKRIETRSWNTNYRGPLAIHAAKGYPTHARQLCLEEPFLSALKRAGLMQFGVWHISNNDLPLGVVVATCELVNCIQILDSHIPQVHPVDDRVDIRLTQKFLSIPPREPELSFGDYTPGRYAWILANVKPLPEPVPAKGSLGLWDWFEGGA